MANNLSQTLKQRLGIGFADRVLLYVLYTGTLWFVYDMAT